MTTEAQQVKFRRQLEKLDASRRTPDKVNMLPRERIRMKRRCKLCGRARAVYRKFGICRICFRDLANNGLIPGHPEGKLVTGIKALASRIGALPILVPHTFYQTGDS
jgi:ribosomal protein S14